MPSVSKQQQKLFGLVRALQKGDVPPGKVSKQVKDLAKKMKKSDVKAYASTKHDDLPKKVKREDLRKLVKKYGAKRVKESVFAVMGKTRKDGYREPEKPNFEYDPEKVNESVNEYEYAVGDMVKDVNPTCPHNGAIGKVKSINPKSVIFVVVNKGKNYQPGDVLDKTHDQMIKMKSIDEKIDFKKAHKKFKETGELPPHLKKLVKDLNKVKVKHKVKNVVVPGLEWMADIKEELLKEGPDPVKMMKLYAPIVRGTMNNMIVAINKDDYKKLKKFHQQFNFYSKKVSEFAKEFLD